MASISSSKPLAISYRLSAVRHRSPVIPDLAACGLLGALAIVFAWQVAVLGQIPNSTDFILQYYPNLAFLGHSLRSGEIPLWNPLLFSGTPYLADPQSQLLYFPDWPFLVLLNTTAAARAILLSHFALAAVGMYAYLRTIRLSRRPAFLGGALYGLGPYAFEMVSWTPMLQSLAWMPVVLLFAERSVQRKSLFSAILAALALTIQFFNGWPHGSYITVFALVATFLLHGVVEVGRSRSWRALLPVGGLAAATGVLAALFSSPLWLPFLEYWGRSNYVTDQGSEVSSQGNVTLLALLGIGGSEGHGAYLGITALVLVLLGITLGKDRKRAWMYGLLALFALSVALGADTPVYGLLYRWIPGFRTFHMPGRFMVLFVFAASALAAMGSEALLRHTGRRLAITATAAGLVVLACLDYALAKTLGPDSGPHLVGNLLHPGGGPYLNSAVASHIVVASVLAGLFLLALVSKRLSRSAAFFLALILVLGDIFLFQGKEAHYFSDPPLALRSGSPAAAVAGINADGGEFRVAGFQQVGVNYFMSDFPSNLVPGLMPPNLTLMDGLENIEGYLPLQLRRYADYIAAVNGGPQDYHWALINNFQSPLLDILNLRYVAIRNNEDRLTNVTIASNLEIGPPGQLTTVRPAPLLASGFQVHSYLGNAVDLEDGHVVARVVVTDSSGQTTTFDLRAGIETAEWAYDRPDVAARVRHSRAPISTTRDLPSPTHVYAASFTFPHPITISQITIERTEPAVSVTVPELVVVPAKPVERYEKVGELDGATLYRNQLALPRVLMVPEAEVAATPQEALERLQSPDFDPRREVVLEGIRGQGSGVGDQGIGNEAPLPQLVPSGSGTALASGVPARAEVKARGSNFVQVAVRTASPGFLLLNELSYPGWNAYLDGKRVEVWRANYLFRAIEVPPGEHYVEFRFEPDSLKLGLALSLTTLVLLVAAAVALRLKSRQQRKESIPR